jgi:hypothetical protein
MPSVSTLYRHAHPEYAQKEKEYVKQYIVKKYNEDPEYKERVKARNLAYYYKKKQEKESKITNDDDVEYY